MLKMNISQYFFPESSELDFLSDFPKADVQMSTSPDKTFENDGSKTRIFLTFLTFLNILNVSKPDFSQHFIKNNLKIVIFPKANVQISALLDITYRKRWSKSQPFSLCFISKGVKKLSLLFKNFEK